MGLLYLIWIGIISYLLYGIYTNIRNFQGTELWQIFMNVILLIVTISLAYLTHKKFKEKALDVIISSALGTLTNTVGVLSMIYLLYAERFVEALGGDITTARKVIFGIGVANGIPEAIVAILIVTSVVGALKNRR